MTLGMDGFLFWQSFLSGISNASIYALVALGLTLILGVLDIADFAQGALYMLGAYGSYYALELFGVPFFLSLPIVVVLVGLVGVLNYAVVYRPIHRVGGSGTFIAALGILFIIQNVALIVFGTTPHSLASPFGKGKFFFGSVILTYHKLFVMVATLVIVLAIGLFLKKSKTGKALRAMAQNRTAASLVGIEVERVALITFALAGALAGVAGVLVSPIRPFDTYIGSFVIIKSFAIVIFGGLGSVSGALVGALIVGLAEAMTAVYVSSEYSDPVAFVLMILILFVRPQGLLGKAVT